MPDATPEPDPDPEPAGPAEVVTPGGATGRSRPVGRLVRIGLTVLALFGAIAVFFAGLTAANPEAGVCGAAVAEIEDVDEADRPLDPDDVDCDDDSERREAIAAGEEVNGDDDLPSESTYRTSGILGVVVGLVMIAGAILTMRTHSRRMRTVALVGAGLGIVVLAGLLFPVGMIALAFVVYAIFFSSDARAVFGPPGTPRMFRPKA